MKIHINIHKGYNPQMKVVITEIIEIIVFLEIIKTIAK